ncbi:MAG: TIGR04255 family protein [Planctomycetes bacterium]|nr:TIGR04255 family protein [Planctomycetota bacterium]
MSAQKLRNAPLIEVIVEIRWRATPEGDPNYNLALGKLSDSFQGDYPEYRALSNAAVPAQLAAQMHMVQHQFRASPDGWPLVQVGPTIFTLNETEAYNWEGDFRERANRAVKTLFMVYPNAKQLQIDSVLLRYIDCIGFDWEKGCLLAFMEEKLRTKIALPESLFADKALSSRPAALDFTFSFRCQDPRGLVHLRFASGERKGEKSLIMETMVQSTGNDVPPMPDGFGAWLGAAHQITSAWFTRLVEGDLYRRFQNA